MSEAVAAVHTAGLYSESYFCPLCIWLSLRRSSQIAGLFFSQSTSICSWPTFLYKWSRSTSFFSASLSFPLLKAAGAASSNCFFQILIWLACTPYSDANSAIVYPLLRQARFEPSIPCCTFFCPFCISVWLKIHLNILSHLWGPLYYCLTPFTFLP